MVPSIGSMTHWRPVNAVVPPNSSPKTLSSGRWRPSCRAGRLRGPIGVGDRSQVGFGLDAQVQRAEPIHSQCVGRSASRSANVRSSRLMPAVLPIWEGPNLNVCGNSVLLLLLVAVLGVFLAQRFVPRGPRGELLSGTLLVTGVSPRPDVGGEQYVTITGFINGPTVDEHAVYHGWRSTSSTGRPWAKRSRWCIRRKTRTTGSSRRPNCRPANGISVSRHTAGVASPSAGRRSGGPRAWLAKPTASQAVRASPIRIRPAPRSP